MGSVSTAATVLGQPIVLPNGVTLPNRFLKSAMTERLCTYSDTDLNERGKPTTEYLEAYRVWGQGKIGTIVLGNLPVSRMDLEAKGNAILDKDNTWDAVEAFKPVIAAAKAGGSIVIGQITHGGRQVPYEVNPNPVSASDVKTPDAMGMKFGNPRPLTVSEIADLVDRFAWAAKALYDAGADGAQLHGAHGYLISQFLSPRVNKRTDQYGGSPENRQRFVMEIIAAIRQRVPDEKFILSIKFNSADFSDGGFSPEESRLFAEKAEAAGLSLLELSGGSYESLAFEHKKESTIKREAYFIEFADELRKHIKKAVLAVTGGFRSAEAMAKAVSEGSTDVIGLGRPLTAEPYFCADILKSSVKVAKPNLIPTALQTVSSVMQIQDFAHQRPVTDLSSEAVVAEILPVITGQRPAKADKVAGEAAAYDRTEKSAEKQ